MATKVIIIDSDDEDDAFSASQSPQKINMLKTVGSGIAAESIQKSNSSTDPGDFQHLYETNFAVLDTPLDEPPSSIPLPAIEDLVNNRAPQTSASPASVNKLKRRNTINLSSLTSVSEPTRSTRKAKRAKSTTNAEHLTQVTTRKSKTSPDKSIETQRDIWDFPSSAADEDAVSGKVKSRNAEKEKRAYSKQKLKRSKTIEARSSGFEDLNILASSKDDVSPQFLGSAYQRASSHDQSPVLPRTKIKETVTNTMRNSVEPSGTWKSSSLVGSKGPLCSLSSDVLPATLQVLQSDETWQIMNQSAQKAIGSSNIEAQQGPEVSSNEITSSVQPESKISILIPNTLTNSQKSRYAAIAAYSASPSIASQPGTLDTIPFTAPSAILDQLVAKPYGSVPARALSTCGSPLSSQQQLEHNISSDSTANCNNKRARSYSASQEHSASQASTTSYYGTATKRTRRNKSVGSQVTPSGSQHSIDELSLPGIPSMPAPTGTASVLKSSKKKRSQPENNERVQIDELFGSDDMGIPKERYEPRLSRRRSISANNEIVQNPESILKKAKRTKSLGLQSATKVLEDRGNGLFSPTLDADLSKSCKLIRSARSNDRNERESTRLERLTPIISNNKKQGFTDGHTLAMALESGLDEPLSASDLEQHIQRNRLEMVVSKDNTTPAEPALKAKRGRPRKKSNVVVSEETLAPEKPAESNESSVIDVAGHSHEANKRVVTTEATGIKSTTASADHESQGPESAKLEAVLGPKKVTAKKRGRPRTKTMPVFASERIYDSEDDEPFVVSVSKRKAARVEQTLQPATPMLQETNANASQSPSWIQPADSLMNKTPSEQSGADAGNETDRQKDNQKQKDTGPETPSRNLDKGLDKHSPLPSGKVAYRVGLSKKRKIAPLLKIRPKAQA